jgi:hypothetical protein
MNKDTEFEHQLSIAHYFGVRDYVVVPNVSWGFMPYECDLLVMAKAGWLYEVEIKISKSDLIADAKKKHGHNSKLVQKLWFAFPKELESSINCVPERAGILLTEHPKGSHRYLYVTELRKPVVNPIATRLSINEQFRLARLGAIRAWTYMDRVFDGVLNKRHQQIEPIELHIDNK